LAKEFDICGSVCNGYFKQNFLSWVQIPSCFLGSNVAQFGRAKVEKDLCDQLLHILKVFCLEAIIKDGAINPAEAPI
jgi:hypothetical protein